MSKKKLIIVGGGVCGLVAAKDLLSHFDITIIEADKRLGGRIHTEEDNRFKLLLELGPEFVHGNLPGTLQLLREAEITTVAVEGKMQYKDANGWKSADAAFEGWEEMLEKMKLLKDDLTLSDFLHLHFSETRYDELRDYALSFASGFDLADPAKASTKALYLEWANEGEVNYRIPQGYSSLINFLEWECLQKGCNVIQGKAVTEVRWKEGSVSVSTIDNQIFEADKIILTVPITTLSNVQDKGVGISFSPEISNYQIAASKIEMGKVIKVFAQFRKAFWPDKTGFFLTEERIPTWWTQLPDKTPMMTGWAGGLHAQPLLNLSDPSLELIAIESLARAFDKTVEFIQTELEVIKVVNWSTQKWIGGAYTYSLLESAKSKAVLNTPILDTIYFSGEAVYEGEVPGTVEAAIIQARETVYQVLKT